MRLVKWHICKKSTLARSLSAWVESCVQSTIWQVVSMVSVSKAYCTSLIDRSHTAVTYSEQKTIKSVLQVAGLWPLINSAVNQAEREKCLTIIKQVRSKVTLLFDPGPTHHSFPNFKLPVTIYGGNVSLFFFFFFTLKQLSFAKYAQYLLIFFVTGWWMKRNGSEQGHPSGRHLSLDNLVK